MKWADKVGVVYAENTGGGYVISYKYINDHQYYVLAFEYDDLVLFDETEEWDICDNPIASWSLTEFDLLTIEQKAITRELWTSVRPLAIQEYEFSEIERLDNIIFK